MYFITEQHIISTKNGWGAIDPSKIGTGSVIYSETVEFMKNNLHKVEPGIMLNAEKGDLKVNTIKNKKMNKDFKVYNLILENDITYIVEGIVVMTDIEQSAPTKELRRGFDKLLFPLIERAYSKEQKFGGTVIRNIIEHLSRHRTLYVYKKKAGKTPNVLGTIYTGIAAIIFYLAWLFSSINNKDNKGI